MNFEKSEYEIQHFNFSVEQMKLENRLMVRNNVHQLTEDFVDSLVKKANISSEVANNIREKSVDVTDKIFNSFSNILEDFDGLVEKYFSIPENVLLPEDARHEKVYSIGDEEYYKERVAEYEKTFMQNAYILTALGAELEAYEQVKDVIERENEIADKVEESFKLKLNLDQQSEMLNRVQEVLDRKNNRAKKDFNSTQSLL